MRKGDMDAQFALALHSFERPICIDDTFSIHHAVPFQVSHHVMTVLITDVRHLMHN